MTGELGQRHTHLKTVTYLYLNWMDTASTRMPLLLTLWLCFKGLFHWIDGMYVRNQRQKWVMIVILQKFHSWENSEKPKNQYSFRRLGITWWKLLNGEWWRHMSTPRAVFVHSSRPLYIKAGLEDPKEVWQGDCETFYNIYIIVLCFSREITHSVISTVGRNILSPAALHANLGKDQLMRAKWEFSKFVQCLQSQTLTALYWVNMQTC